MEAFAFALAGATLVFVVVTGRRRWLRASDKAGSSYWLNEADLHKVEEIKPLDDEHVLMSFDVTRDPDAAAKRGPSPLEKTIGRIAVTVALLAGAGYILILADDPSERRERRVGDCGGGDRLLAARLASRQVVEAQVEVA
jgi:hypothetical protein